MLDLPLGNVLAFDFGEVRIGVAQGHSEVKIAHPISTITGNSNEDKLNKISELIKKWQPDCLVVGLPVYADGTEHELTHLARKFGHRLNARFRLPVYWADERFSSVYAESLLREAQIFGKKNKAVLDQVAAQAILQSVFECGALGVFVG